MDIFQVDETGRLFISPDIDDWSPVHVRSIDVIFDLDDDVDIGIPNVPNHILYVFFPFEDRDLPNLERLHAMARLGASAIQSGSSVLSHCGMGHNRSALLAGLILTYLGMSGEDAVARIRERRRGALYNKVFATYLESLPSGSL